MPALTCPNGHHWQDEANEAAGAMMTLTACPVCGQAAAEAATLPPAPPSEAVTQDRLAQPTMVAAAPGNPALPGYEVLAELGRGGMGVVYKARQLSLNRVVALKMILAGGHAGAPELARFKTEAEAIARLQHPNIVQVHEVGEHDGLPFFSLEFCPGGSLDRKLEGTPLPPREAARLVETLARAMHAAHQAQVIHRDLKPANVLLSVGQASCLPSSGRQDACPTDGWVPKITDFGLAKKLDEAGQTASNVVMGTPSYMAPEQAGGQGKQVGPAADVYSLGAILYECLTGRPPFRAPTAMDTLLQVLGDEPVPPRALQSKTPRDLETVCLKCLRKEPHQRYGSAAELADDLARFQADQPIQARPVSRLERGWRWCRRNPAVAGLAAAVTLAVLLGSTAATFFAVRATREAGRADDRADAAETAEEQASRARNAALQRAGELRREKDKLRDQLLVSNTLLYAGRLTLARREWQNNDLADARKVLAECPAELVGWEHGFLRKLCAGSPFRLVGIKEGVFAVASSADGRRLATAEKGSVKLWDLSGDAGKLERTLCQAQGVRGLSFRRDGKLLASAGPEYGTVTVWDCATGKTLLKFRAHKHAVSGVTFSPDGAALASVALDGSVLVSDAASGKLLRTFEGHKGTPTVAVGVAFSPDGRWLASGGEDATVRLWDVRTGKESRLLRGHTKMVLGLAFDRTGKRLASAGGESTLILWEVPSGRRVRSLAGVTAPLAFHPDGKLLAAVTDNKEGHQVQLWDVLSPDTGRVQVATGAYFSSDSEAGGPVVVAGDLTFSPDGKRLATLDRDLTRAGGIKLWDVRTGLEVWRFKARSSPFSGITFSPDGKFLAGGSRAGILHLWSALPAAGGQ